MVEPVYALTFLPYLPLSQSYELGDWVVAPLTKYDGPWLNDHFESAVR